MLLQQTRDPRSRVGATPQPGRCRSCIGTVVIPRAVDCRWLLPRHLPELSAAEAAERRAAGRRGALRLRAGVDHWTIQDDLLGPFTGVVDDVVLRRNDGVAAYNLAVVVDDAAQGVDQIVRGDDLLTSTPRQAYLASLLGLPAETYAHVPLALNSTGQRLAKRDGAVTLADLAAAGRTPRDVLGIIASSLGLAGPGEPAGPEDLLARFDPDHLPRTPWTVRPEELLPSRGGRPAADARG